MFLFPRFCLSPGCPFLPFRPNFHITVPSLRLPVSLLLLHPADERTGAMRRLTHRERVERKLRILEEKEAQAKGERNKLL